MNQELKVSIKSWHNFLTHKVEGLEVIPNFGDNIELRYFNAYLDLR